MTAFTPSSPGRSRRRISAAVATIGAAGAIAVLAFTLNSSSLTRP